MLRKLFSLLLILLALLGLWVGFALWTGMYAFYSIPPGPGDPEGSTLLVAREPDEPMFDSPAYVPPPPRKPSSNLGALRFAPASRPKRTLADRTIVALPFVEWAYKKSLEKPQPDAP